MEDDPDTIGADSASIDDLVDEAEELLGTDALWRGQIVHAAAELEIFTVIDTTPTAASDVAAELELNRDRTYRLLRALAHFGVLKEDEKRRFTLTPLGELFQADHPKSLRSDVLFNRSPEWLRSMLHLPAVVKEGGPPGFVREFGTEFFDYIASNPENARVYDELMELASRDHPDQFLDSLKGYDFSRFSLVCDVGGGRGHFLCHLLAAVSHLEGVVFDLPRVVNNAGDRWAEKLGVANRCRYVEGDMFERVPEADGYFLKWILHNWDDDDCHLILSNVHDAASSDGRLFLLETLVPGPSTSHYAKRLDVTMMTQVGGRERTRDEYRVLLEGAGWELEEVRNSGGPLSILEAVKA